MGNIVLIVMLIVIIVVIRINKKTVENKSTHKPPRQVANIEQQEKEQMADEIVTAILPTISNDSNG